MPKVESVSDVQKMLGIKIKKGKPVGVFPEQRHLSTNDKNGKMEGMVLGSALNKQQKVDEISRGKEYNQEVSENPEYYNNEQP